MPQHSVTEDDVYEQRGFTQERTSETNPYKRGDVPMLSKKRMMNSCAHCCTPAGMSRDRAIGDKSREVIIPEKIGL